MSFLLHAQNRVTSSFSAYIGQGVALNVFLSAPFINLYKKWAILYDLQNSCFSTDMVQHVW